MSKTIKYRPEIDGLRAIAVLPVMLFHAGIGPFTGGYVGVDIFFVISGFLITSILYREISSGAFTYTAFYERRARRILPALYSVLFASLIAAWFLLVPSDLIDFAETLIGTVGFFANITLWLQIDYFDQAAELKPLLHMWSLAVEEQYYIVLPILLIALTRYAKKHALALILLTLVMSLLISQWGSTHQPSATYYLLPTRAWEMLLGSAAALLQFNSNARVNKQLENKANILSFLGLFMLAFSIFAFDEHTPFPSFWALIPTVGTVLLILCAKPGTIANKILANRVFVGVGLISYSAYLWHQPVYAYARHQTLWDASHTLMYGAFCLSMLLAYLSWRFIEQPFRNRAKISVKDVWIFSSIGGTVLIIIGLLIVMNNGFDKRFNIRPPLTEATFKLPTRSNGWCFYSVDTNSSLPIGEDGTECTLGAKDGKFKALLFGDSHAGMYEPFWDTVGKELSIELNAVTTNWCHPSLSKNFWWQLETRALDQCLINRQFVADNLKKYDLIIVSAVWSVLQNKDMLKDVHQLVDLLANEKGIKVVIMAQPHRINNTAVISSVYRGVDLQYQQHLDTAAPLNTSLSAMADHNKNIFFIDRQSMFSPNNESQSILSADGIPYSLDGGHISIYGSLEAAKNFSQKDKHNELKRFIE